MPRHSPNRTSLQLDPALLAPRLVTRRDGLTQRILVAHHDLDFVLTWCRSLLTPNSFSGTRLTWGDINDGHVLLDRRDDTLDDGTFRRSVL